MPQTAAYLHADMSCMHQPRTDSLLTVHRTCYCVYCNMTLHGMEGKRSNKAFLEKQLMVWQSSSHHYFIMLSGCTGQKAGSSSTDSLKACILSQWLLKLLSIIQ